MTPGWIGENFGIKTERIDVYKRQIYRFIACYGWPVMTREQKEIFYNSTLDLTQENLERCGFELLDYESSKLKYAKFFEEEGVDGWCEIIFSTQEEMKQYVCKNLSDVRMSQFIVPTYTLAGKREKNMPSVFK